MRNSRSPLDDDQPPISNWLAVSLVLLCVYGPFLYAYGHFNRFEGVIPLRYPGLVVTFIVGGMIEYVIPIFTLLFMSGFVPVMWFLDTVISFIILFWLVKFASDGDRWLYAVTLMTIIVSSLCCIPEEWDLAMHLFRQIKPGDYL